MATAASPSERSDIGAQETMPPKTAFPVVLHARLALYHLGTVATIVFFGTILALAATSPYAFFTWHPICMSLYFFSAIWSAQVLAASGDNYGVVVAASEEPETPPRSRESISDLLGERDALLGDNSGASERVSREAGPPVQARKRKEWLPLPLSIFSATSRLQRRSRLKLHLIFHCLAFVAAIAGLAVIVINKIRFGRPHFATWHGFLGLITVVLFSGQVVYGFLARNDGAFGEWFRRAHGPVAFLNFRKLHRINGVIVVLPLLCVVAGLAVYELWTIEGLKTWIGDGLPAAQIVLVVMPVLAWIGVAVQGALR